MMFLDRNSPKFKQNFKIISGISKIMFLRFVYQLLIMEKIAPNNVKIFLLSFTQFQYFTKNKLNKFLLINKKLIISYLFIN